MERERLLGAAAPVVEASTSGFALDGVVRTRRDRARLAAAVAALLGCAALAGSSLAGASVAALGDGDGPAELGDAGEPNAWGTKHNALPWWSMPAAAASASAQAGLGVYAEDEATAAGDGDGGTDDETQPKPSADVLAATERSAEPNEKLASGEDGEDVSGEDGETSWTSPSRRWGRRRARREARMTLWMTPSAPRAWRRAGASAAGGARRRTP
jgi:hypothetical protein